MSTERVKPRRAHEVDERRYPKSGETGWMILVPELDGTHCYKIVALGNARDEMAYCDSAKRLSDWFFENGGQELKQDFDWKYADGEA